MRFQTSDPDIATIFRRIERKTIDLQPDFQRGEVWSAGKKQRLIDTIMRRWHVPPVHLVAKGGGKFDVLDGQQRLTAIRDFMNGLFAFDATIEPIMREFGPLHGLRFSQLPAEVQDEFESFAIRVFELHDYTPDEPHELFFRLNQPMTLTEAEKRNAFIGPARNQIKELVDWAGVRGLTAERLGFSNARMAYDDLLARFLLTLEQGGLTEKVTALRITTRYREKDPFPDEVVERAHLALEFVLGAPLLDRGDRVRFNKATIHTWLCIAAKLEKEGLLDTMGVALLRTVESVESWRARRESEQDDYASVPLTVFNDRATARVADVSSVVLRDFTACMVLAADVSRDARPPSFLRPAWAAWDRIRGGSDADRLLSQFSMSVGWGETGWL